MMHINDISKSFGTQVILDQASLHIRPGMRIGLVGPNGAGKTTLFRIIAGEMSLDEGDINARKGLRIGFLPQEIEEIAEFAVLDEVLASYADILDMEHRLKGLGERISAAYEGDSSEDADALMNELGSLQTAFEHAEGYELESRAQSILRGMGFNDDDFDRPIKELSGGWRMRVALARLLMETPDLLLLDEPTNHLDLESLLWLEEFLLEWTGSLVLVSHDRYFLNRMVTHIVEMDRGGLDLYTGNYDHFEIEKQQRYEALSNAAKNQQREIESAESFVRRFRAKNTKAKQVQQKVRQLEKMERIDAPNLERKKIRFRFPQPGRTGRVVVEMQRVRKAYGDTVVYKGLDLVVERGEKIALVGPNGAGKSTLLKLLAGAITPDGGSLKLGHNVRREYFAQHQLEVFDPDRSVLKTMEDVAAPVDKMTMVRGYLGTFLFTGDDVEKKVGVLSGGEKARLALARMLLDPAGLLLLDEPTNHLDMASREVLSEALRQFEGSVIFISHDRHLINAIATEVIEVKAGRLTHYIGDWEYYQWKSGRAGAVPPTARLGTRSEAAGIEDAGSSAVGLPAADTPGVGSPSYRERKDMQRRHRQLEKRIMALEDRQRELGGLLADPAHAADYELLMSASAEATEIKDELAGLYPEWEVVTERVAALE
ncbi:MAG TPA: ABC-F family ATP-binding cassette domain-containing protein [Thermoleophilia bacterium]|nr:ABC-F family ATP-binding cassette domain-containing protein [Thermoleophilia bacterium]